VAHSGGSVVGPSALLAAAVASEPDCGAMQLIAATPAPSALPSHHVFALIDSLRVFIRFLLWIKACWA
jgi:hypothetical protein